MDRNRQAVMEKARAKNLRRAEKRKRTSAPVEAKSLTETVKGMAHDATETLSSLVIASTQTIKHLVVGPEEPTRDPRS